MRMMTTSAAAEALNITRRRVRQLITSNVLPAKRDATGDWIIEQKSVEAAKNRKPGRPRKVYSTIIEP